MLIVHEYAWFRKILHSLFFVDITVAHVQFGGIADSHVPLCGVLAG